MRGPVTPPADPLGLLAVVASVAAVGMVTLSAIVALSVISLWLVRLTGALFLLAALVLPWWLVLRGQREERRIRRARIVLESQWLEAGR